MNQQSSLRIRANRMNRLKMAGICILSIFGLLFGAVALESARTQDAGKLSAVACAALPVGMLMHAKADDNKGGNSGGTLEEKLSSAQNELKSATESLNAITLERDGLQSENTSLKAQFDALTQSANEASAKVTELTNQITTLTSQVAEHAGKATKAAENITRLETLCSVKGIDPNSSVPASTEPETLSVDSFEKRISSAKTPAERAAITSEFQLAVKEGRVG